jgi:hypothetical protein
MGMAGSRVALQTSAICWIFHFLEPILSPVAPCFNRMPYDRNAYQSPFLSAPCYPILTPHDTFLANFFDVHTLRKRISTVERPSPVQPWYYFPHFPQAAIQAGAPWKLLELQGKHGMFFVGSSCCFESVLDVMAYNDLIFKRFGLAEQGSSST